MKINLKEIWSKQESESNKQVSRERISNITFLRCYIGFIGFTGGRMFQLEMDSSVDVHKNYLRKFRGVEIQVLPNEDGTLKRLTIILIDKELSDIFTLFIEDIIDKLITESNPKEALLTINQRVNYWRKLFTKATGEILSPEQQRGLFGELFLLQLLLNNGKDKKKILSSWYGSEGANQDFSLDKTAIEVKTSKSGSLSVYISNEYQLEYEAWSQLYLCIITVNESSGKHNTLYGLSCKIKDMLNYESSLIDEFEYKLNLAGIRGDMIDEYNEVSYTVSNYRFYEIIEDFPVITRSKLDNEAIYNVKYQIDINACRPFEISEEEVLNNIL